MNENRELSTTVQPETISQDLRVAPPVDVYENRDELLMLVDVPGVEHAGLNLRLEGAELDLEARQTPPADNGNGLRPLTFARSFTLPRGIDAKGVSAELKNGVLRIVLNKSEDAKPRRIEVKAH